MNLQPSPPAGARPLILVAEDEAAHAAAIERAFELTFEASGWEAEIQVVDTLSGCQAALERRSPDLLLLDLHFPDGSALPMLAAQAATGAFPILAMSSQGSEQTAVEAMKSGAMDYIVKAPETLASMPKAVERGLREWKLRQEHVEAMRRIAQAEETIRKISVAVEHSPAAIVITDTSGTIEYVNPRFTQMTGYTSEEVVGQNPRILKSGDRSAEAYRELWSTILSGRIWRGEFHNRKKNGELYWEQASISPIRDAREGITSFIAIKEDITDRKRADQARLELEQQVLHDQRIESLGVLAGGIAHDFNNILTAILGNAELVLRRLPQADPLRKHLESIQIGGRRARDLVEKILLFSRQIESRPERVEVASVLEETLKLLRAVIPTTIAIQVEVDAAQAQVLMDPTELHQAIMNVCVNGAHAMGEGVAGTLTIALHRAPRPDGEWIELLVGDTGSGIPSEIRGRIFDPFFTTKGVNEGTGLGLSVVHGIIQRAGGRIEVDSEVGVGSRFRILLPEVREFGDPGLEGSGEDRSRCQGHILLVEDESAIREMLGEALESAGFTVKACDNGHEALQVLKAGPGAFQAILSDQTMPLMTGLQLAQEASRVRPGLPFVLMTGLASPLPASAIESAGISSVLLKPVLPSDALRTLQSLLAGRWESEVPRGQDPAHR